MGKNWAICVGIDHYYNLKPLKYAQRDAAAFRDFCKTDAHFETVYFFAEGADPIQGDRGSFRTDPTIGNLERFLRVRCDRPFLESGDNLWFFFAGHGKRANGRDYLMPIDGDPGNVGRTGLAIRDIADRLRRSGADNVLLFLDACRSEDDRDGGEGIGVEAQQGVITLYSCSPNELAYEIDDLKAGAFTHALLEGLRMAGEGNCATVGRLYEHLRYRVPQLNQHHGKRRQTPYAITEPATKLNLILLPQHATPQDVLALKNNALEAEAEANLDRAEQLWIRVLAASAADRQAISALQRIAIKRLGQGAASEPTGGETTAATSSIAAPTPEPAAKPALTFPFEVVTVNERGEITQRAERSAEYRREDLGDGVSLDLVRIPGGTFMMGQTDAEKTELIRQLGQDNYQPYYTNELPQHQVSIPQFWMGKYPVTQAQYQRVMGHNPAKFTAHGDRHPVEQVSWDDAVAFCQVLSKQTSREYRLPSEAEWEYACRAGTTTPFHVGLTLTADLANYNSTSAYGAGPKGIYRQQTTEVGCFPANAFGLYDMHGNVWEWCLDRLHNSYDGAPTDESAWVSGNENAPRVLRGGSWCYVPRYCRSANRSSVAHDGKYNVVGFRVVCSSSWALA